MPLQESTASLHALKDALSFLAQSWRPGERLSCTPEGGRDCKGLVDAINGLLDSREELLVQIPVPLLLSDEHGKILFHNKALLALCGQAPDDSLLDMEESSLFDMGQQNGASTAVFLDSKIHACTIAGNTLTCEASLIRNKGLPVPVRCFRTQLVSGGRSLTLSTLYDMTERDAMEKRLRQMAYFDPLTGLPNRNSFLDELDREIRKFLDSGGYLFSVILADMDRFKLVNEQIGSREADKVLLEVVERIKTILGGFATIFRIGGDEFAAIIHGTNSREYMESLLTRLQRLITMPISMDGDNLFPSASIAAILDIAEDVSSAQLLARLSDAVTEAKKQGFGTIHFESSSPEKRRMQAGNRANLLTLTAEIQNSLTLSHFVPYFQPIYQLSTRRLAGFETLVRWHHPSRGILSPAAFIAAAEESGLIADIDRQIISRAIETLRSLSEKANGTPFFISANVSGASLRDFGFVPFIESEMSNASLPPDNFVLEVTESMLIDNLDMASAQLEAIKRLKVRIALDDFGTGYSSLQYINQLPIDCIKIDKSFMDQLFTSPKTSGMVKTIIDMAHTLNLKIVVEGIENEDQVLWLSDFDVQGQGYFFSQPVPLNEAESLLKDAVAFESLLPPQK